MNRDKCWLPPINPIHSIDKETYSAYEAALYEKYRKDFWESSPDFKGKVVKVRRMPIIDGYEESFVHFTCKSYENIQEREPDLRRCERLHWIRPVIENYLCKNSCREDCDGIKFWEEPFNNKMRIHLLFEAERYIVILEKRENYYLLITAYYLEYDHSLKKQLKHYSMYKKTGNAPCNEASPETPSTTGR